MPFIFIADQWMATFYAVLSDLSHPLEGTFYLFLLAVIFRWRWPVSWNNLLKSISADIEQPLKPNGESKATQNIISPKHIRSDKSSRKD